MSKPRPVRFGSIVPPRPSAEDYRLAMRGMGGHPDYREQYARVSAYKTAVRWAFQAAAIEAAKAIVPATMPYKRLDYADVLARNAAFEYVTWPDRPVRLPIPQAIIDSEASS